MKWQPIETAPKDGTNILLYEPKNEFNPPEYFVGRWEKSRDPFIYGTSWECSEYGAFNHHPTHWIPLPDAPKGD